MDTALQRLVIWVLVKVGTVVVTVGKAGTAGGGEGVRDSDRSLKCAFLGRMDKVGIGALVGGGVSNLGIWLAILGPEVFEVR